MWKLILSSVIGLGLFLATFSYAGEISGNVKYSDGSNCSGCRVSASINSGGVTEPTYTDSRGNFTLKWSSNNWIAKLFVNGKTVKRDVKPGEHVNITVK